MLGTVHKDLSTFHYCRRHKTRHKSALVKGNGVVSGCYDGRGGINIARARHDVALYVHCLGHTYFCPELVMNVNTMQSNSSHLLWTEAGAENNCRGN
jgi:hypothetical protein